MVICPIAVLLLVGMPAASEPVHQPAYPVQLTGQPSPKLPLPVHRSGAPHEKIFFHPPSGPHFGNTADPVVQTETPIRATAQALGEWEGLGEGYPGFTVAAVPPDTNIAVGPNHIVQWVNDAFVVFDKQGNQLQTPVDDSTFWGMNSACDQGGGFSDPIIEYDRAADRWVVAEVALPIFPGLLGQYAQCFAVSKASDPSFVSDANGNNTSYNIWAYGFGAKVNDYGKIAVWSDGYYITWNIFQNGSNFIGPEACAWNRNDMLQGMAAPKFVCFQLSTAYASLLPSDVDGATGPPAGSPNYLMEIDPSTSALNLFRFHADFKNPSDSTFTGPFAVSGVAPFTAPCPTMQDCIPQPGTTQLLDALGDRLMSRLAYHNYADHESITANHTVLTAGGNTGVRWYEVRSPGSAPAVYQQGTFAPDTENRWMASVAMDRSGNIGLGYSVASAATYPSIRYTGWEAGNTLGTLQAETPLVAGGGSQTGYNRWGDYSAMRIDPSDDCTFWYTHQYQAVNQAGNWNTRIGSFKFSSCGHALASATISSGSSMNPSTYQAAAATALSSSLNPSTSETKAKPHFTVFDPKGSVATYAVAVNNDNVVAGYYTDSATQTHSFIRLANGSITSFDVAGATNTAAQAINGTDQIAGYFTDGASASHGFLRARDGAITKFDVPGASGTTARTINAAGAIAGDYTDAASASHGFLRTAIGAFTKFDVPGATGTFGVAINSSHTIAGYYVDSASIAHGYIRNPGGTIVTFDPPGSVSTTVTGINIHNLIVGYYSDSGGAIHGFLRRNNGKITTFDIPGAVFTIAVSDNTSGEVAGTYVDTAAHEHGFYLAPRGASTSFDPPGSTATVAYSINVDATISGSYQDSGNALHGYLRTLDQHHHEHPTR